ncbi:hypothetical protein [Pedobacter sp. GR22-6]
MAATKKNSKKSARAISAGAEIAAKSSSVSFPVIRLDELMASSVFPAGK